MIESVKLDVLRICIFFILLELKAIFLTKYVSSIQVDPITDFQGKILPWIFEYGKTI